MIKQKGRLLVIKLGALGDFVLATGPFAAIRTAHPNEDLVLLTTAPFATGPRPAVYLDTFIATSLRPGRRMPRSCNHFCLPGPVDAWSWLLLRYLVLSAA